MKKFRNTYRTTTTRLQSWDYANNGAYFITICTKNREHFFGAISKLGTAYTMQLNNIGAIAHQYWMEIPNHFPFVRLGNFVVMPNHTHGIIIIDRPTDAVVESPNLGDSTIADAGKKWKPGTIGVIINQYKRIVTINARKINAAFKWQPRFYDRIIWNDAGFQRVQKYIADNPKNWHIDKLNR